MPSSRESSQPRDQTQVSSITVDSFPSEPPGKPKNTGVGSLSLFQGNFLTQEQNWGLLHCMYMHCISQLLYFLISNSSHDFYSFKCSPIILATLD